MTTGIHRIGILVLCLLAFSHPADAAGSHDAVPASNESASSFPPNAPPANSVHAPQPGVATGAKRAVFARIGASRDAHHIADWVVDSGDNAGLPFVIVDKTDAKVFLFDASGRIQGAAPALLGLARGDSAVPGIGDREYADIPPKDRTTPAGRFVASLGRSTRGEDVLWVDYEGAVSLHRVVTNKPKDRRLERLATPTPLDNRISYGCINVPVRFYEDVVSPAFKDTAGIVYVLPDTRPVREVFGSYDVDERVRNRNVVRAPRIAPAPGTVSSGMSSR